MTRVVIDTGVALSAGLQPAGTSNQAFLFALFHCQPLISFETFSELEQVLNKTKFEVKISEQTRTDILKTVLAKSIKMEVFSDISICRDASDNMFLNLAKDGKADVIISRDPDLLTLNPFEGIPILSPADFLKQF
jgi:putative PIN family toxin of toxin-antitoxin system